MKAREVLRVLRITRPTLTKYVKAGLIGVKELPNGRYEYNNDDVIKFLNMKMDRITCIYASSWVGEDKNDVDGQVDDIRKFCLARGYTIGGIYKDINCNNSLGSRGGLKRLIGDVIDGKVERVVVYDVSRLSLTEGDLIKFVMNRHNCVVEFIISI